MLSTAQPPLQRLRKRREYKCLAPAPVRTLVQRLLAEAVGVPLLPAPGVFAHCVQVHFCTPIQFFGRFFGVRPACGDITWSSVRDLVRHGAAACALERRYDLKHALASARAEIVDMDPIVEL